MQKIKIGKFLSKFLKKKTAKNLETRRHKFSFRPKAFFFINFILKIMNSQENTRGAQEDAFRMHRQNLRFIGSAKIRKPRSARLWAHFVINNAIISRLLWDQRGITRKLG